MVSSLRRSLFAPLMVLAVVQALAASACSHDEPPQAPPARGGYWANSPPVCGTNEVREYHCDELLPLDSALPAPAPYANCPGSIEGHYGEIDPKPTVAVFDADFTRHTRARMAPGHSCCYSWCAALTVVDASSVDPQARCGQGLSFGETYCFDEPEQGASSSAPAPFNACPGAIMPPEGVAFSSPAVGARFDPMATTGKRQLGFKQCCYSWCSLGAAQSVKSDKKKR